MKPTRPGTSAKPKATRNSATNMSGASTNNVIAFPRQFNALDPFPTQLRRQFTYCTIVTLTSGNGLLGTQQAFRLNSLYDPDYTGAGHQPYGFDQMSGLYSKYRVDKVKFELLFTTPGAANDMLCVATVAPGTSSFLTGAALDAVQERPDGLWGVCSSSGDRRCALRGAFDLNVVCGVSRAKYEAEDNYSAGVGANPSQDALLACNAGCVDGTNGVAIKCMAVLTYDAVLFNRITQAQS